MNSHKELGIDLSVEYQFVDEVKAPKLVQQGKKTQEEEKKGLDSTSQPLIYYAVIKLEREIFTHPQSLLIASKLDKDITVKQCRLAFYGQAIDLTQD